jgi:hypothetical protein
MDICTQLRLGMHGIESENPSFDERGGEKRFECADLVLFFLHIHLKKHDACFDIIGTQLMNWVGLFAGGSHRFAVDSDLGMFSVSCLRL